MIYSIHEIAVKYIYIYIHIVVQNPSQSYVSHVAERENQHLQQENRYLTYLVAGC